MVFNFTEILALAKTTQCYLYRFVRLHSDMDSGHRGVKLGVVMDTGESKLHSVIDTTQSHVTKKYSSNLKRQFHKFFDTIAFMI